MSTTTETRTLAREVTDEVLRPAADEVDATSAFPTAGVEALDRVGLLSAATPTAWGGAGLGAVALTEIAMQLARGCGSTAMVWAMHQVQVACVARHSPADGAPGAVVEALTRGGGLVASVTSERGVGGRLRQSVAACHRDGARVTVRKEATTVSYVRQAAAYLVTARSGPDAAPSAQVAVLVPAGDARIEDVGRWDMMGMRGTQSPGCVVSVDTDAALVLPDGFHLVAARTMVPFSHLLWSAIWLGLADEAVARALRVRGRSKEVPGSLVDADAALKSAMAYVYVLAARLDDYDAAAVALSLQYAVELNNLKLHASACSIGVAREALEAAGMAGYAASGSASMSRLIRDLHSGPLMISNQRLRETNAAAMVSCAR
jgi:acyl-CoA dehydrogenase